jgi:tRNA(Arg) A34 adenosine deaminase TadA
MHDFTSHMPIAIDEAKAAGERGEVPVGAVIVSADGEIIARAGNETRALNDPTAHAEILAIRRACAALGSERLIGCSLWVTLEPCPMCAAAIGFARISRLYFGASDPKSGGVDHGPRIFDASSAHHVPEVFNGIAEDQCTVLLRDFFAQKRRASKKGQ